MRGIAQCATFHLASGLGLFTKITLDSPLWTVVIELYGSALVLLLVWVKSRSTVVHVVLAAASCLMPGLNLLYLFALGHIAALLYRVRQGWVVANSIGLFLICTGIVLSGASHVAPIPLPTRTMSSAECAAVLIFAGVLFASCVQNFLTHSLVQFLGRISFSVYLLHEPVFYMISSVNTIWAERSPHTGPISFAIAVALTIGVSFWFERWVDAPSIAFSRRLGARAIPVIALAE